MTSAEPSFDAVPPGSTLVLFLAFGAERLVEDVLARVPGDVLNDPAWHFLVIDDTERRAVADAAARWSSERRLERWTVLRNLEDQGHGGIQKLAFRWAVDRGFDLVVLLPGDGQYSPEHLAEFRAIRDRDRADVILASRMLRPGDAAASGMPALLRWANRRVTAVQNRLAGTSFSEFHTGCRAYSGDFLRRSAFEAASNDYHFETEMLLQAAHAGAVVREFPIRVRYDRRLRRVGRGGYAWASMRAALRYRMHRTGAFCSLQYRGIRPVVYTDKGELVYSSHAAALDAVRALAPAQLLDVGCGPGFVAQRCERAGVRVTGLDVREPLPRTMSAFHRMHLDPMPVDAFSFPVVMMLDVIEHLADPEGFLLRMRNESRALADPSRRPVLLLSTPNVAFAAVRLNLLLGRFNYAERGILDIDHRRLFTRASLRRILEDCGYDVLDVRPVPPPFEAVIRGAFGRFLGYFGRILARLWPTMFAFQFLVRASPRAGLRVLLERGAVRGADASSPVPPSP
jgi:2-polyprenyl-3-methyl-5-hydroxy-6-metoxy-1,4-benzoquinol methylase